MLPYLSALENAVVFKDALPMSRFTLIFTYLIQLQSDNSVKITASLTFFSADQFVYLASWLNNNTAISHRSTRCSQHRVTLLTCATTLPMSQMENITTTIQTSGQRILMKGCIAIVSPLMAANGFVRPSRHLAYGTDGGLFATDVSARFKVS